MPIPVLRQGDVLIASLQAAATDADLTRLKDDLAARVGSDRIKGVVIDVTALDVMDSFATRMLRGMAQTTKLRGAEMIVVGLQPDVAFAMIQLGLAFDGISTALDLEEGVILLKSQLSEGQTRDIG